MAVRNKTIVQRVVALIIAVLFLGSNASAQVAARKPPPAAPPGPSGSKPRKASTATRRSVPVVVDSPAVAPQVVTILHRLNGLKMFRLLLRSSEEIGAIARLDEAFRITDEVHTSVIAGLAMDDGHTIAVWLPEVDAEMGPGIPSTFFATEAPRAPRGFTSVLSAPPKSGSTPALLAGTSLFERPDLTVIARDGRRLVARYVGLDGVTGLSVLKLADKNPLDTLSTRDQIVSIGQRLRLLSPEPVEQQESPPARTIYVRMGETEGRVVSISRAPSGSMARIRIRSAKLSPVNIGGIAINDAGETIGIVDAVESNEATLLPNALVRSAASRVVERQSSVPRPWLGIQGDPVGALPFEQIMRGGWPAERAKSLVDAHRGILLTSVAPDSPAAGAALRPGDVILRVNDGDVKSADDFSWLLEEAGPGTSVHFTVARPGKLVTEAVEVRLAEAPDPGFGLRRPGVGLLSPEDNAERILRPGTHPGPLSKFFPGSLTSSLIRQGIETIALKPVVAARFGAKGGLLVVYVNPTTTAFRAGLRSGDVIEAIDGQQVSSLPEPFYFSNAPGAGYSFNVVRNKEKQVVTVVTVPK